MTPELTAERIGQILRRLKPRRVEDPALTPAAVLMPLFIKGGEWHLLFTRRSEQLPVHAGQISFPGGARDPEDPDLLAAALRESREEMGIAPADVTVLGQLDDLSTITGFCITAFVGLIPYPYPFQPNHDEIAEVIEIPLADLLDPAVFRRESSWVRDGRAYPVYFFRCGKQVVWGATAKIVKQFLEEVMDWKEPGVPSPQNSTKS